ncbi:GNAT family N-acetyltransferase [Streptomyces sp. 5.8]|uniref:GNAT family N-acetyltransferase n=1 Tax=Streptomyces sp. 5.8 TaxID=3406571 RepID=UPI003BB71CFA
MASRRARPPFRFRDAGHRDLDAFMTLIRQADPDDPSPFNSARFMLGMEHEPPLSHNLNLCLIAEDQRGKPVGALLAGPPDWVVEHPGLLGSPMTLALVQRITMIQGVAVDPKYRGRGIGSALIRRAEQRYRHAGWGLSMLIHAPVLEPFYRQLGYVSDPGLLMYLPAHPLIGQDFLNMRTALKPLATEVRLANVLFAPCPVISGLLPGTQVPHHAWFDGAALRH